MSILIDDNTRLIVQGITGKTGSLHAQSMAEYGTKVVAGVRPGAEGQQVNGVPVYDLMKSAVEKTGANASIMFVPATQTKAAAIEAIQSGIKLLVITTEHVPVHDAMEILANAREMHTTVIGPNTAGLIAPSKRCKVGFVPNKFFTPGSVGIASRSGTLMYELAFRLSQAGMGQSSCVGVGGDPIVGTRMPEVVRLFEKDKETKAVLLIGEIGGSQEEDVAALVESDEIKKPVLAYIAGYSAPKGKKMGHAGAIVSGDKGTIEAKLDAFKRAGIKVAKTPGDVSGMMKEILNGNG